LPWYSCSSVAPAIPTRATTPTTPTSSRATAPTLRFVDGEGIPLPTVVTGATATTQVRFLRLPGAGGRAEPFQAQLKRMTLAELAASHTQRIDALEAAFDFLGLVAARMELIALLMRTSDPQFEALVPPLMGATKATACAQLAIEVAGVQIDVDNGGSRCVWEAYSVVEPVMGWVEIGQRVQAFGDPCAVLDGNQWLDPVEEELRLTVATMSSEDVAKVTAVKACQCDSRNPQPPRPDACSTVTDEEDEDTIAARLDGVDQNVGYAARVGVIESDDGSRDSGVLVQLWQTEVVEPYFVDVHERTWAFCHDDGEQWGLAELSALVADPTTLLADLQYCGSQIGLGVRNDDGDVVDTATAGGEAVATFTTAASVSAPAGATLVLSGPLRTLKCHPAGTENDAIVVKRVADTTTEVARRTGNAGRYLLQDGFALELDVDTLRDGLEDDEPISLEVWRETPACGGTYGPAETRLFTIEADPRPPFSAVFVEPSVCGSTALGAGTTPPFSESSCSASFATPNRLETLIMQGGAALYIQLTLDRPGTVTATISETVQNGNYESLYGEDSELGVFLGAPFYKYENGRSYLLCNHCSNNPNPLTASWHEEAGSGTFLLNAYRLNAGTTTLAFEFTPDP